jgi:hypothetical protein
MTRPLLVGVGALVGLIVAAGLLVSVKRQRDDARSMATALLRDTGQVLRATPSARQSVEAVTGRALAFGKMMDVRELPPGEKALLAEAWLALGELNVEHGRVDDAQQLADACSTLVPSVTTPPTRPEALIHARCLTLRARLLRARDVEAPTKALVDEGVALLKNTTASEPAWLDASAELADALSSLPGVEEASASMLRQVFRERSEALMVAEPGRPRATVRLATSLTREQLRAWRPGAEEKALALGERSIALLEGVTSSPEAVAAQRALALQLRQQASLLQRADQPELADPYLLRARPLFEGALAMDPASVTARHEFAQLLVLAGEPAAALAQLERLPEEAVVGDALVSSLLAALLADRDEAFEKRRAAIARSDDPQAHWLEALYLAQRGQLAEASTIVHAWGARGAAAPVRWPFGRFDVVALRAPAEAAAPLRTFFSCVEASLRAVAEEPACFSALAEGLDAAAQARRAP